MTGVENLELGLYVLLHHFLCQLVQEAGAVLKDVAVGPVEGVGVKGAHLGLQCGQMLETLVVLILAAGGGEVDDDINALLLAQLAGLLHCLGELLEAHGLIADLHHAVHFLVLTNMDMGNARTQPLRRQQSALPARRRCKERWAPYPSWCLRRKGIPES